MSAGTNIRMHKNLRIVIRIRRLLMARVRGQSLPFRQAQSLP